jgi:hypothetical protein
MTKLYYSGIGSRETPTHILSVMRHLGGYLCSEGWILRSGAAHGADAAFEEGVPYAADSMKEIYLPWVGYNNHPSPLHPGRIPFTIDEQEYTEHYHPAWNRCSPTAKLLHQRNTRIVWGHDDEDGLGLGRVSFIICWTEKGLTKGGTGQALRIAEALKIPVFNLGKCTNDDEIRTMMLAIDKLQGEIRDEHRRNDPQAAVRAPAS